MNVTALNIFPIKSTAGIGLQESAIGLRGLRHDRNWVVVDETGQALTGRESAKLFNIRTALGDDGLVISCLDEKLFTIPFEPQAGDVTDLRVFSDPATGLAVDPEIDAWFSDYLGLSCRLMGMNADVHRRMVTYDGEQTDHPVAY